jgi:hypothetical protein
VFLLALGAWLLGRYKARQLDEEGSR